MLKKFNLTSKTALITGGGGMLGFQHAFALLQTNAKVILVDINLRKLKDNQKKLSKIFNKNKIKIFENDVSNEKKLKNLLKILKKKKINLNILINNAAIDSKVTNKKMFRNFEKFSLKNWNKEISVGLSGSFLCTKIFGNEMAKKNGGVILNIASDLSVISPDQRIYNSNNKLQYSKPITYSVIKHGIIGLTKYTATYWAKNKIRCNALSPGGVKNLNNSAFNKRVNKLIPMNRLANKEEYISAVQFLCSDASSYMTGHNLIIDGGRSVW